MTCIALNKISMNILWYMNTKSIKKKTPKILVKI